MSNRKPEVFFPGGMSGKFKKIFENSVGNDGILPLHLSHNLQGICAVSDGFACGFNQPSIPP